MSAAIAGIDRADDDVAFQRLRLRPVPGGMCRHAGATFRSPRGLIASAWRIEGDRFTWELTVPPNCSAEVHVPCHAGAAAVREGDLAAREAPGLRHLRDAAGYAVFAAGAGSYRFSAPV
jgi:alpha-L-rhamnosidase